LKIGPAFYRTAAIFSVISAITTLMLIFLPQLYAPVAGFEGRMAAVHDPWYAVRSWAYLVHPFLTFAAALGVCLRIRSVAHAAAIVGVLGFFVWAFTEAAQQCLTLFAFDRWRVAYTAGDPSIRAHLPTLTVLYDGLWDAMYVLLLIAFAIGNASLASVLVRQRGLSRLVGYLYIGAVLVTLRYLVPELGWQIPSGAFETWAYPLIQPIARVLIGIWLWRHADERAELGGIGRRFSGN